MVEWQLTTNPLCITIHDCSVTLLLLIKETFAVLLIQKVTRISAVAERPRVALCLSVVSFNGTIPRAQYFIISYFGFRFTTACNWILFCCLRRNVEASCHKHFVIRLSRTTNNAAYCYHRWVSPTCHGPPHRLQHTIKPDNPR